MIMFSVLLGLAMTLIGTLGWISQGRVIYPGIQLIGTVIFLEGLLFSIGVHSHWKKWWQYFRHLVVLAVLGAIVGVLYFDVAGLYIFKLWEYTYHSPSLNSTDYLKIVGGWALYFLIFHESYLLIYHYFHKHYRRHTFSARSEQLFKIIGPLGIILVLIGVAFPKIFDAAVLSALLTMTGAWFILEGFEFPRKRPTLLSDLLQGNWRPLLAILVGGTVVGFLSEFSNILAPTQYWIYHRIPWPQVQIMDVPLSLLLSWSTMYIIFLSLENFIVKTDEKLWE